MATIPSCLLALSLVLVPIPPETPAAPDRAPALLDKAATHLAGGENDKALVLIDEALLLDPESGRARAMRCMIDDGIPSALSHVDRAAARRLIERTVPVDYDNAELGAVLDDLAQRGGVDIFVNWATLDTIGVRRDDRITLETEPTTTAETLDALATLIGGEPGAGWRIRDGRVAVSTRAALRDYAWTVVYDVRDLVRADDEAGQRKAVNQLIDQLRANIDPEGWHGRGGHRNRLQELNGNLIITSTPWNHRAIESTLHKLRSERARAEQPRAAASTDRGPCP